MEEGKGERYLASGRQYGNALLGVRHQEEEWYLYSAINQDVAHAQEAALKTKRFEFTPKTVIL